MNMTPMQVPTTHRKLLIAVVVIIALGAGLYFSRAWPGVGAQILHEPVSQPLGTVSSRAGDITIK